MNNKFLIYKLINNNNLQKLKNLLDEDKNNLYTLGPNYQYPIHDACLQGNKNIINLLLSYDDKILNTKNNNKFNGYQILAMMYPNLLIYFLKKYKPENINHVNDSNHTILSLYFTFNKIDESKLIELSKLGCSLIEPKDVNGLFFLLENKYNKIDIIKKYFKIDVNKLHEGVPISFILVKLNNLECLKKLIKLGLNLNLVDKLDNIFSYSIINNNKNFVKFLLNQKNIDKSYTDRFENNYFKLALINDKLDNDLQKKLLKMTDDINKQDVIGNNILHTIFKLKKFDKFKDLLIQKEVNLDIVNKDGYKPLDYLNKTERNKTKKLFKKIITNQPDDFNFIKLNKVIHTPFSGYYWMVLTSIIYIIEKYNIVGFPICESYIDTNITKSNFDDIIKWDIQDKKLSCLICGRIFYQDKKTNYISSNLLNCIKNIIDKRIIILYLSIYYKTNSHAGLIIIDNKKKEIERFETYGISNSDKNIDFVLSTHLIKIMFNLKKTKYKYFSPSDYQNIYDFQSISQEYNRYINECEGFCVSWTFWYLEHRLLNINLDRKILIKKLKKKLLKDNDTILDNIRSYADKLEKYMRSKITNYKINKFDIYLLHRKPEIRMLVYKKIFKDLINVQKSDK